MTNKVDNMYSTIQRQRYEIAYIPQVVPILGAAVSIITALVSGIMALVKVTMAILFKDGKPFFRPTDKTMDHIKFPMEDAKDLAWIFANNVANICTLGFLNCFLVLNTLSNFVINKNGIDD